MAVRRLGWFGLILSKVECDHVRRFSMWCFNREVKGSTEGGQEEGGKVDEVFFASVLFFQRVWTRADLIKRLPAAGGGCRSTSSLTFSFGKSSCSGRQDKMAWHAWLPEQSNKKGVRILLLMLTVVMMVFSVVRSKYYALHEGAHKW